MGLAATFAWPAAAAFAAPPIDAGKEFGLDSNDQRDQSKRLQKAMNAAASPAACCC